ncbi:MAG: dihydropyrimidinase [Bacillota bacterium]
MDLLVRGGTIVNETGQQKADVLVQNGKIIRLSDCILPVPGMRVIDAHGMLVLPGVIDVHTHYGMVSAGGNRTADDFFQGSASAACGGVTTIIDYAEPLPGESLLEAANKRRQEAEGSIAIDFSLHMVIPRFREGQAAELKALLDQGISSCKVFTTYKSLKIDVPDLLRLLKSARDLGVLVTVHAEDDDVIQRAQRRLHEGGMLAPRYHPASRPVEAEVQAIKWLVSAAAAQRCPLYFVHVSSGEGCRAIGQARQEGMRVMGETCPHYLLLTQEKYQSPEAQQYIMSPPLRRQEDIDALWAGLSSGALQVVATDHCSYTREQKQAAATCLDTLPGIPGSETLLPLMYSEGVGKGRITLGELVGLLAGNPARIFGLYPQKGVLAPGSDADMVILDPYQEVTISAQHLHSAAGYTPFEGWQVKGYPVTTILRGRVIYSDGRFSGAQGGGAFIPAGPGTFQ